jgi:opacity protein-like surface antigen
MNSLTRNLALLGGIAVSSLLFSPIAKAVDISVAEQPGFAWYFGLFGGYKWGNGEVDIATLRHEGCLPDPCEESFEGISQGEPGNGWIFGGTVGAQLAQGIRAEIEVSHARLDTETTAIENLVDSDGLILDTFTASDEDRLSETFILANAWFHIPTPFPFSPYLGGGLGVAHVKGDFGVDSFGESPSEFSASIDADDWSLVYQIGTGLILALSENFGVELGYRFKIISHVDLDDPEFCGGDDCEPPIRESTVDKDFGVYEHVVQLGLTLGF